MLRRIVARVIMPDGQVDPGHTWKAGPHSYFKEIHEERAVEEFVSYLDQNYPAFDFRMVKVGPGRYNFIYAGSRKDNNEKEKESDWPCA